MNIIQDISDLKLEQGSAVSIGNFDGIHRGHRYLVDKLVKKARQIGVPALVATFDPHPIEVLHPGTILPKLTTMERRAELLEPLDVDLLFVLKTDEKLLDLSYLEFFQRFLVERFHARAIVEGPNFFFGRDREGTPEKLQTLCDQAAIDLTIVPVIQDQQRMTSSSLIRRYLADGNIQQANQLLVTPYQIRGRVQAGAGRGRTIGFPTANLDSIKTLLPGDGVYVGMGHWEATSGESNKAPCAVHIGGNPTFSDSSRKTEVHLLDVELDLYNRNLSVDFLDRIREPRKFETPVDLIDQIRQDIQQVREFFRNHGKNNLS